MHVDDTDPGFEFSDAFDRQFLADLYGNDLHAAEEIFQSSLAQVRQEIALLDGLAARGDVDAIRRLFHKIKPLFGYMGLLSVQDYVQAFEQRCLPPASFQEIDTPLMHIRQIVSDALVETGREYERLKEFNNRRA
jgi:HPt (histidine-containing phosphotransfer) domain-containing protein